MANTKVNLPHLRRQNLSKEDNIKLPFSTDGKGAAIYLNHLIKAYNKNTDKMNALLAAFTRYTETWPDDDRTQDIKKVLKYVKGIR